MQNLKLLLFSLIVFCCLYLFSGCYKLQDYLNVHGDADYKACNIKKITNYGAEDSVTWVFKYNLAGNPISVITSHPFTSNPNYYFTYDKHDRVIELLGTYPNGNYDQWDRVGYNSKGQIAVDTGYGFGIIIGGKPQPSPYLAYLFNDYDAAGRIIHVRNESYFNGVYLGTSDKYYTYDANGNLNDGSTYDNRLSPHRTNVVWMYLKKNYSLNNPFIATSYNEHSLPVVCRGIDIVSSLYYNGYVKIEYSCN